MSPLSDSARILADAFSNHRFIAYFDFLGFSEIVRNNLLVDVINGFLTANTNAATILNGVKGMKFKGKILEPVKGRFWFSDTLILYSEDIDAINLYPLSTLATFLIATFLKDGFPTRCVITKGQFYVGEDIEKQNFFLGKGLIQAFELEKSMNWCGGIIDPKIYGTYEAQIKKLGKNDIITEYEVPLKKGNVTTFKCLAWPKFYVKTFNKKVTDVRHDMTRRISSNLSWPVENKIRNTENYCNQFTTFP